MASPMMNALDGMKDDIKEMLNEGLKGTEELVKLQKESNKHAEKLEKTYSGIIDETERGIRKIASEMEVAYDVVEKMVTELVKLKIVPTQLDAVTKFAKVTKDALDRYVHTVEASSKSIHEFFREDTKASIAAVKSDGERVKASDKRVKSAENALRAERKAISKSIEANEKAKAKAVERVKELEKVSKTSKKTTEEEIKNNQKLSTSLQYILDNIVNIKRAVNSSEGIKIQINNAGFTRVLNEMANAIDRFHERSEVGKPRKKNFFDQLLGTKEENKKAVQDLTQVAEKSIDQVKNDFLDPLGTTLTRKIHDAITKGIRDGITDGAVYAAQRNPGNMAIAGLSEAMGLSQQQRRRLLISLAEKVDETEVRLEQLKQREKHRQFLYTTRKTLENERAMAADKRSFDYNVDPESYTAEMRNRARKTAAEAQLMENRVRAEEEKRKRDETNRLRNAKEQIRIEKELAGVYGEEGSSIKKLGEDLVLLQAKRREIEIQGKELNKINFAELANNTRKIQETTRKWAAEMYKVANKTEETSNLFKTMQNTYTRLASLTQTFSAAISAVSGIFGTMRSAATSFFKYFTNGFRRAFSYARSLASTTLSAGIEQRKKIEQAEIGFASFFGADNVAAVTSMIRNEAAKTPIVDAGSLADYVQQLAPVSKGNANLAVNAALGMLKTLVYSGSDISEGENVIKNIRDVIAKGKATAIDIRQFNRALPGLEKALADSGQTGFIDKEGKLNITKANVGKVLELFANLNTSPDSPLKNIEAAQQRTLAGLQQLFNEKKTTASETILQKSGVFSFMYDVMGIANDEGKWATITNTIGTILQPLVRKVSEFLNSIDWREFGARFTEFFRGIGSAIQEAKDIIMPAISNAFGTASGGMDRFMSILTSFVRGLANGISETINIISVLVKKLANGNIEKFAELIGKYLISPLGKLIQMAMGLTQNGIGAISRVFANIASMYKGLGDVWNWAVKQKTLSFSNRIVSNLSVKDMTAAQLQQLIQGKSVTANGKDATAAAGVAMLGASSANTAVGVEAFGTKIKDVGLTIGRWAAKIGSALVAGGTIYLITRGLSELIRTIGNGNKVANVAAGAIETLGTAIAGGVAGSMLGGLTGGLIGAVVGAAAALIRLKVAADQAANEERKKQTEELEGEQRQKIYDGLMKVMKEQGINTDTGTDEGWYASKKLKQWLNGQDPNSVDLHEAAMVYAHALRYKDTAQALLDTANSTEWNNLGGNTLDLKQDTDLRNRLGELIKYFRLNGDYYDYDNNSTESIIKEFMNGDQITGKQAQALVDKWEALDVTVADSTTDLADVITENTGNIKSVVDESTGEIVIMTDSAIIAMNELNETIRSFSEQVAEISQDYRNKYNGSGVFGGVRSALSGGLSIIGGLLGGKSWDEILRSEDSIDQRAAGYTSNAYVLDEDGKKVYVLPQDVASAIDKYWIENSGNLKKAQPGENYYESEYGSTLEGLKTALNDLKENFTKDTSGFLKKYRSQFPWLEDYIKKIIFKKQYGGLINPIFRAMGGMGLGVDTVPAMLQPGEFVMRKRSVDRVGLSTMLALNRGDLAAAARSMGSRFSGNYNNSRNWSSIVNNNQKTQSNYIRIYNKNRSAKVSSYYGLANRIALA